MNKIDLIKQEFPKQFCLRYEQLGFSEGLVEHPVYGGKPTHCRSTLWTLVKILQPRSILEIGSWKYDGSNMMARSLDENFGKDYECEIHTFDIVRGGYTEDSQEIAKVHKRVKPMWWYPHHTSYDSWKYNNPRIEFPLFSQMDNSQIFKANITILEEVMPKIGYDLIVIDGDHSIEGVKFDWEYACHSISNRGVIVIDDLYDSRHWQVRQFWDSIKCDKYDFEDWNQTNPDKLVSMGVV